jgi:hypothetical protein
MTVPWIALDASNVYITGLGRSHNIYFLWLGEEFRRNQRKRTPVQLPYRIFPILDISLNDVSLLP